MYNLESSIAEWRRQMLAAGLKTPVPLEELESHLREEIEQQTKSGLDERQAFKIAVQQIGQREVLQREFAKNRRSPWRSGDNRTAITNQILGVLWLAQSTWFFIRFATSPVAVAIILYFPHFWQTFTVFFTLLALAGIIGSIFLLRGAKLGLSIIRIIAILEFLLCVTECVTQDGSFGPPNYWFGILSVFSLSTAWFLRSIQHGKLTNKAMMLLIAFFGVLVGTAFIIPAAHKYSEHEGSHAATIGFLIGIPIMLIGMGSAILWVQKVRCVKVKYV